MNKFQEIEPPVGVTFIRGINELNQFYSYFSPIPILPFTIFYDKDFMINFINTTLDGVESITKRIYSDSDCAWRIEYGTKPLEEIIPQYKEKIAIGRYVALKAAEKAAFKDTSIIFTEEDDLKLFDETSTIIYNNMHIKKWSSIIIHLCFNLHDNRFVIYIKKEYGDSSSYVHIAVELENKLQRISNNRFWFLRKNYLQLLEGLPEQTGRDNVLTYLFDGGIVRDVCSNML